MKKTISSIFATLGFFATMSPQPLSAAVSFNFSYDNTSTGFWDSNAQAGLSSAVNIISSYLTGYSAVISMNVTSSFNSTSSTLASAGSNYSALVAGTSNLGVVGTKILSNGTIDQNGSAFDGTVDVNFGRNWHFGDLVGASQFDLISTLVHELAHALGFTSQIEANGSTNLGAGFYTPFDGFLVNGAGVNMVTNLNTTSSAWAVDSLGGTGTAPATPNSGLYFGGPNAVAANGGNLVPIFSPTTWDDGSSGSHLDDHFFNGTNQKNMNSASPPGPGIRTFSDIEIGIFRDLGYTQFGLVPEPSRMILLMLALIVFTTRRHRQGLF